MANNKLSDLNDHLFNQLERLGDPDLKGEALETEINRSKAISSIAKNITENAKNTIEVLKLMSETGDKDLPSHLLIGDGSGNK
jgi:hypothetical protein